jgi:branched-subunit amino acid transport protein
MSFSPSTWWAASAAIALGTYLTRASFVVLLAGRRVPPWARRLLAYIPCSVLPALVVPAVLLAPGAEGTLAAAPLSPKAFAAVLAALVAWRTRSVLGTILVGMGALLLLRQITG